jgi:putative flippase GtrA
LKRSFEGGQFWRFVAVGAANSIVTYLIYLALLQFVGYAVAYTVSYACGIAFSYIANSLAVFRAPMSVKSAVRFPMVYLAQYLLGMALMWLFVDVLEIAAWLAPWITTVVLVPVSFVLTRRMLRGKPGETGAIGGSL